MQQGIKAEDKVVLSAGKAEVQGCTVNLTAPSLSCADLLLQQADFSAAAPGFFLFPKKKKIPLALSVNKVKIIDSKALLLLHTKNSLTIPLKELNIELKHLQAVPSKQEKDNLELQAVLGAKGKLRA
ncbi:MAG: hypothetical protein D3904_14610, partial [Candidatus Electrothrix sp. EH2]|nr:hypothetical protein [Candidatus Electrothrix sp. EH2]